MKIILQKFVDSEIVLHLRNVNNNKTTTAMSTIASATTKIQRVTRATRAIQLQTGLNGVQATQMLMGWLYDDKLTWAEIAAELDA